MQPIDLTTRRQKGVSKFLNYHTSKLVFTYVK